MVCRVQGLLMVNKLNIQKICIVRLSAIGDVTLCIPLVMALKRSIPNVEITWVTSPSAYELLRGFEGVEFIIFNKSKGLNGYIEFKRLMRNRSFDALLALQASWRANLIYPLINSPLKIGFDRIRSKDCQHFFTNNQIDHVPNQHLLDSYLSFLNKLGIDDIKVEWALPIEEERTWAIILRNSINKKILLVNPAASKAERTWKINRYIEAIRLAQNRWNLHVILTGGPNSKEISIGKLITKQMDSGITNLIGKTTVKQFAALTEVADAILSPDTAAVHFGAAANVPVIGLYAVATPDITGPYKSQQFLVNRYPEAVKSILKKDPTKIKWGTRVHSNKAMDLITVPDVLEKLGELFP